MSVVRMLFSNNLGCSGVAAGEKREFRSADVFTDLHEALIHNAISACNLIFTAFPGTVFNSVRVALILEPGELHLTSAKRSQSAGCRTIRPEPIKSPCRLFQAPCCCWTVCNASLQIYTASYSCGLFDLCPRTCSLVFPCFLVDALPSLADCTWSKP